MYDCMFVFSPYGTTQIFSGHIVQFEALGQGLRSE